MIPLPTYVQTPLPNLGAGYFEFRRAVAFHCGYGTDSTLWTSDQRSELDDDVNETYGWCLRPPTIPGEGLTHKWSWTEQTTTLVTVADDFDYTLPLSFGSMVGEYLYWGVGVSYAPVYRTNDSAIEHKRQSSTTTGRPQCFAIRWKAQNRGVQQRQEIIFWPTPDAVYTLTYKYHILAGRLGKRNPFPLGGPRMGQLMREGCKAIGENKKNGRKGDQWDTFMTMLRSEIDLDASTNTQTTVGRMRYADDMVGYMPPLRSAAQYYFGPNADGSYTLET